MIGLFPTHKVTIQRPTFDATNDNGFGGSVDQTNVYTDLVCSIYESGGNESVIYGGDRSVAFGTARFYAGVVLQEGDVIVFPNDDPLEITRVFVRRVGLGIPFRVDCEWRRIQA